MLYDKRWDRGLKVDVDETSRLLNQAADVIDHLGHCKRALERGDAYCVMGALMVVEGKGNVFSTMIELRLTMIERLSEYLKLKNDDGPSLVMWNNAAERTADDVVAALRGAAK